MIADVRSEKSNESITTTLLWRVADALQPYARCSIYPIANDKMMAVGNIHDSITPPHSNVMEAVNSEMNGMSSNITPHIVISCEVGVWRGFIQRVLVVCQQAETTYGDRGLYHTFQ